MKHQNKQNQETASQHQEKLETTRKQLRITYEKLRNPKAYQSIQNEETKRKTWETLKKLKDKTNRQSGTARNNYENLENNDKQ